MAMLAVDLLGAQEPELVVEELCLHVQYLCKLAQVLDMHAQSLCEPAQILDLHAQSLCKPAQILTIVWMAQVQEKNYNPHIS